MNPSAERRLLDALVLAVRRMPAEQVASFTVAISSAPHYAPKTAGRANGAVANSAYRNHANAILTAWADVPDLSGAAVALALNAAAASREAVRSAQSLEIVWTGPNSHEAPVRRTFEVLLELIGMARRRLTVVSFAAYRVEEIQAALAEAAGRGAIVRLVLESSAEAQGRLSQDAAAAFASLGHAVSFYVWPASRRDFSGGSGGLLHAKAVIADDRAALVTSANLTGRALSSNMELGLLVRGGPVPERLNRHFEQLISAGVLQKVTQE